MNKIIEKYTSNNSVIVSPYDTLKQAINKYLRNQREVKKTYSVLVACRTGVYECALEVYDNFQEINFSIENIVYHPELILGGIETEIDFFGVMEPDIEWEITDEDDTSEYDVVSRTILERCPRCGMVDRHFDMVASDCQQCDNLFGFKPVQIL